MTRGHRRPDLLERLRALPAAGALLAALGDGDEIHLVGGAVRDLLRGEEPVDLDLVVEGEVGPLARRVAERVGGTVQTHERFGTATVAAGGSLFDLARARAERYPRPGALPDVWPAPLAEDLLRRDFSVHAVALSVGGTDPGQLRTVPHALEDLDARRLRVLHDESFRDDPTRLLRLARYGARLGFAVEARTAELAAAAVHEGALATVSGPRSGRELRLAAGEPDPIAGFTRLGELGVLSALHPQLGFDSDLAARALALLPEDGRRDAVVIAVACLEVSTAEVADLLTSLGFEREESRGARSLRSELEPLAARLSRVARPSEIDALLAGRSPAEAALVGALGASAPVARWLSELRHVRLEIDGDDLRRAGAPEGPALGAGLARARAGRLDGELAGREAELAAAVAEAGRVKSSQPRTPRMCR